MNKDNIELMECLSEIEVNKYIYNKLPKEIYDENEINFCHLAKNIVRDSEFALRCDLDINGELYIPDVDVMCENIKDFYKWKNNDFEGKYFLNANIWDVCENEQFIIIEKSNKTYDIKEGEKDCECVEVVDKEMYKESECEL